ncbi:Gfo/Idh/MocA family protein [Leeia oryzae]|uniref:Gfo/Idh/MocA family protein n=1 Tax=Leeia oryzae TaxID=356662 RepID=UPI00038273BB|nr:Gfo/Idh/MocA family oxidoreductase [Leeia oryzae]
MSLRVGVIGTGAIGQEHIRRLSKKLVGAEVVAVNDINKEGALKFLDNEALNARFIDSPHDLINAADVDAIVVTSWGPSHEEFVLASIAAGKPVFCEKPLATTAEGCYRIVEAEMKAGKKLVQVGFMRRYDQGYKQLKAALTSGQFGAPLMVHCAHRNPSVPDAYVGDMPITDTFVHEIDVLRWLLDDDYVSVQVVASKNTKYANPNLKDPILVLLETKSGIRINGEIFVNCKYGYDIQCEVVAEEGVVSLPEPSSLLIRQHEKLSTNIMNDWKLRFIDSYDVELQAWINDTKAGKMTGPSAWDGYFTAVTSDACIEAKNSGKIVAITTPPTPAFYL